MGEGLAEAQARVSARTPKGPSGSHDLKNLRTTNWPNRTTDRTISMLAISQVQGCHPAAPLCSLPGNAVTQHDVNHQFGHPAQKASQAVLVDVEG